MTDLLIVTDGPDVTADLFAQAAPAFGIGVRVVSLRAERLDLRLDLQATVEIDGLPVTPDIVINRCTANPSGLPSVAALSRQTPGSWSGSFAAAREEQGLVLAAFEEVEVRARVRGFLEEYGIEVPLRDVNQDAAAFRELVEATGRTTVPCLRIQRGEEVEWMFESMDIIRYLAARHGVT